MLQFNLPMIEQWNRASVMDGCITTVYIRDKDVSATNNLGINV